MPTGFSNIPEQKAALASRRAGFDAVTNARRDALHARIEACRAGIPKNALPSVADMLNLASVMANRPSEEQVELQLKRIADRIERELKWLANQRERA